MAEQYRLPEPPLARRNVVPVRLSEEEITRLESLIEFVRGRQPGAEVPPTRGTILRWGLDLLWANFSREVSK